MFLVRRISFSFISKFGFSPDPSSPGVDGEIYLPAEDEPDRVLTIQPRTQTLDNLAKSLLSNTSDYEKIKYSLSNTFDRFPFSSHSPPFDPSKAPIQTPIPSTSPQPRVYSQTKKVTGQSKQSLTNPNVLFCKTEEITTSIIY